MIQINKLRIRFISGVSFIPFKLLQWIYTEKNSKFTLFFIRVKGQEKIHISSFAKVISLAVAQSCTALDLPHLASIDHGHTLSSSSFRAVGLLHLTFLLVLRGVEFFSGWLCLFFVFVFYFDGRTERALRA